MQDSIFLSVGQDEYGETGELLITCLYAPNHSPNTIYTKVVVSVQFESNFFEGGVDNLCVALRPGPLREIAGRVILLVIENYCQLFSLCQAITLVIFAGCSCEQTIIYIMDVVGAAAEDPVSADIETPEEQFTSLILA